MKKCEYNYYVVNLSEGGEEGYEAIIPKFRNLHVFADTVEELHGIVSSTIEDEIKRMEQEGIPVPQPDKKSKFSGKILLRIPPNIHEKLLHEAQANSMSLNRYILGKLDREF